MKKNVALILVLLSLSIFAETFTIPRTSAKPTIDGVIQEHEYTNAATFVGAANYRMATFNNKPAVVDKRKTICALTWDENYIYVATRSQTGKDGYLPDGGSKGYAMSTESIELWFDPPASIRQTEATKFGQFQITVGWTGICDMMHHNPGYGYPAKKWKANGVIIKNSISGDIWDCEIAIPASAFGAKKIEPGNWKMLLGRNFRTEPQVQCTFAPFNSSGGYTDPTGYSKMRLAVNEAPSHFNGDPTYLRTKVPVAVPGNITVKVKTSGVVPPKKYRRFFACQDLNGNGYFGLQEVADPDGKVHITFFYHVRNRNSYKNFISNKIPVPGEETYLSLNVFEDKIVYYMNGAQMGEIATDVPIKTGDFGAYHPGGGEPGINVLAMKAISRTLSSDEIKQIAQSDKGAAGELRWYPSKSLMACELSFAKPSKNDDLPRLCLFNSSNKMILEKRLAQNKKSYVITEGSAPMVILHEKVPLTINGKTLPDGKYKAAIYIGQNSKPVLEKIFISKQYEWFNTNVGKADVLLPGFTPVKADGNTVEVVGRKYVFGENGLPQEVFALGKQILARPISVSGITTPENGDFKITKNTETRADFTGALAKGRVEQDGLIIFNLQLPECKGDVFMDIPVKPEYAKLFHACGQGIRSNPAGFLPKGQGRIYGSRSIPQTNIDNFIPYCWIGTDDRGICYAADVDRGWEHCKDKDAVEIHRENDGTVLIRLNLINGSGTHKQRNITLALMASPVKPMPKGWRGWVDAYDVPAERNTLCNCSNPTWGCYIVGMARYPSFMDWEFVRKMSESARTGKVDDAYVERWIDRCWEARSKHPELVPWLVKQPSDEAAKQTLRAHAFAAFRRPAFLHDKKDTVFYYYTCFADPMTGLYELPVMNDEWNWNSSVYGSHLDYAIFYLKKMCENGMTGVYNDNAFFHCNYDWVTGGAWIDNHGEVHPSFSLWHLREYCRRQILAMKEAGIKSPWLTIHHTNGNILPALGFATNTMGMEWKYGTSDFQDRFSQDYIRAVNQGYQGGFFATSLEGIFDCKTPEQKTHVTRTMLAALLPHEVQPTLQQSGDHKLVLKVLGVKQAFGVGKPDCKYYPYYSPENPVVQHSDDIMISTYKRGNAMLLVIGSYANKDTPLDLKLKSGKITSAINAENDNQLDVKNGICHLNLKRHDFAIIKIK